MAEWDGLSVSCPPLSVPVPYAFFREGGVDIPTGRNPRNRLFGSIHDFPVDRRRWYPKKIG